MKNAIIESLRLLLPLAEAQAEVIRHKAQQAAGKGCGLAEYATEQANAAEAATHAVTAARLALADVESATKAKRKGKATDIAWVSGGFGDFQLRVARVPSTRAFRALEGVTFNNYRAAQDIANAIRAHVRSR